MSVHAEGTNEPPALLVKEIFPVGVLSEWEASVTLAMHSVEDPGCSVEGVQFRLTTMPKRVVVELLEVVVVLVEVVRVEDVVVDDVMEEVDVLDVEMDVVDCEIVEEALVVVV